MTVTWKDYKGPYLGYEHKKSNEGDTPIDADQIKSNADGGSQCCIEERDARKAWAREQNRKEREEAPKPGSVIYDAEIQKAAIRVFDTGANRDKDDGKLDFEGFMSPAVIEAYASYMNFNRRLNDGSTRNSDNWQKGIPLEAYIKSGWRHFFDWWKFHRGAALKGSLVFALCGVIFNAMGYLHEYLKANPGILEDSLKLEEEARTERLAKLRGSTAAQAASGAASQA